MPGPGQTFRHAKPPPARFRGGVVVVLTLLTPAPALAHQARSNWTYPPACCQGNGLGGDCQAISGKTVREHGGGWVVVLRPGDHHKVTHLNRYFVPYGSQITSGDGEYHICLYPTEDHANCFFVPPDAM